MALELTIRPDAAADLRAIKDYIASDSPERAAAFIQRIQTRCLKLTEFPESGTPRDDLRPGLRLVALERRVVIVYRVTAKAVEIGRIFYGGRNVEDLLASRSASDLI